VEVGKVGMFIATLKTALNDWIDAKKIKEYLEGGDIGIDQLDMVPTEERVVYVEVTDQLDMKMLQSLYRRIFTPEQLMAVFFVRENRKRG